ncbi:MAG: peptidoglycan-binding protein [Timaviella obliquedivisa GSE-PSE-MK23-08B]|jgi:peptidoglycan hydrolase-like protein with peptidoglycan-binding domain|nr:peptidoglycan-binding protein [Timaviella obliquedivisa GSE-PSE-MK23-08B]
MKIFQFIFSVLPLMLVTAALVPAASSASAPTVARPSGSTASPQLISQAGIMSLGGSGPLVSQLQEDLASLGYYSGTNTGYFGSVTEEAVIRFQQAVGLTADGRVGPATSEAIQQRIGTGSTPVPVSTTLRLNDTGAQVSELQRRLITLGYFDGSATGFFGSQTQAAVINFQQANGITADGIVGIGTAEALRQAQ